MWSNHCQPVTLEASLASNLAESERINTLLALSYFYIHDIADGLSAKPANFIEQAERLLANQPRTTIQHAHLCYLKGYKSILSAQWERAMTCFNHAIDLYKTHGDKRGEFEVLLKFALLYAINLNFEAATTSLAHCRQIVDEDNNRDYKFVLFCHDAAIVHVYLGSGDLAEAYAKDCYQYSLKLPLYQEGVIVKHNLRFRVMSQWVLARVFDDRGQYEQSLKHAQQGLETLRSFNVNTVLWQAALTDALSVALVATDRFDETIDELLPILNALAPDESIIFGACYVQLGKAYANTGQDTRAEAALHYALVCYRKLGTRQYHELGCLEALARLAKQTGDHAQCINYLEELYHVSNSYWEDKHNHEMKLLAAANEYVLKRQETEILRVSNEQLNDTNHLLQTAYDEQSELVRLVVHDINNPLSVINLRTDIAGRFLAQGNVAQATKSIAAIGESVAYMTMIVDQLQTMEEVDEKSHQLSFQAASLSSLLEQAVERNRPVAVAKQIDIVVADLPNVDVWVGELAVQQVFDNLISNAIKYSWPDTAVQIAARHDEGNLLIDFVDNGVGLDSAELPKLFTKFGRLTSSRPTNDEQSTGLGLYITQKLLNAMNGEVTATSDGLNKGTTFTVRLPIQPTM